MRSIRLVCLTTGFSSN
uniref:Uncharacterized protein n=1 Tax=Arundo donax TaxID=35708 RepID=A0A0A8YT28_ARUDO